MKALFYAIVLMASLIQMDSVTAQTRTEYKDLSDRAHVPLYDCSIFSGRGDQNTCQYLKQGEYFRFENEGYAVSCYDLSRSRRNSCLRLAEELHYNTANMIDCYHLYRDQVAQRQCEITKLGYFEGRFHDRGGNYRTQTRTTTTRVVRDEPVYTSTTTCDYSSYDRAVQSWRIKKEEQRKRGQTRAAVGVVATIGGLLLGGSDNRTTRAIGQGLTIGGVFLTTWGLVEMVDADITYPHLDPYCKTNWTQETRMVVIEEQQCVTTRYSERNGYSSRYYYEVNCSNKRYVTFEEFRPWDEGRRVSHYNY